MHGPLVQLTLHASDAGPILHSAGPEAECDGPIYLVVIVTSITLPYEFVLRPFLYASCTRSASDHLRPCACVKHVVWRMEYSVQCASFTTSFISINVIIVMRRTNAGQCYAKL